MWLDTATIILIIILVIILCILVYVHEKQHMYFSTRPKTLISGNVSFDEDKDQLNKTRRIIVPLLSVYVMLFSASVVAFKGSYFHLIGISFVNVNNWTMFLLHLFTKKNELGSSSKMSNSRFSWIFFISMDCLIQIHVWINENTYWTTSVFILGISICIIIVTEIYLSKRAIKDAGLSRGMIEVVSYIVMNSILTGFFIYISTLLKYPEICFSAMISCLVFFTNLKWILHNPFS